MIHLSPNIKMWHIKCFIVPMMAQNNSRLKALAVHYNFNMTFKCNNAKGIAIFSVSNYGDI